MRSSDIIAIGTRNLFRRKLRTLLTVIGVVVGTTAIVVMVSLAVGMNESLEQTIASMGDLTVIELTTYSSFQDENGEYQYTENQLDETLVEQIRQMDGVVAVMPMLECWQYNFNLTANRRYQCYSNIVGVDFDALKHFGFELETGEFPENGEEGSTIIFGSEAYYDFRDPNRPWRYNDFYYSDGSRKPPKFDINTAKISLNGYAYKEIVDQFGNYNSERVSGKSKTFGNIGIVKTDEQETDYRKTYCVYVDIETLREMIFELERLNRVKSSESVAYRYETVKIKAEDMEAADKIQANLKELGISVQSLSDIRKSMQEQRMSVQLILAGIGAMSLVVAAIGIANTMIMSIYERTKEIGVMKVLGCPLGSIKAMFLYEAAMIGFIGGIFGIAISFGVSYGFNNISSLGSALGTNTTGTPLSIIPLWLVIVAIVFSTLIGLLSGYFPATKATKISALEAIKNEG